MKLGAVYPQIELSGAPEAVHAIGTAVEAMGLKHLVMYDHVLGAVHADRDPPLFGPYTEKDPFHDPFVAFGYLAGITKAIDFITGVLILPQRQTVLVAKQATDVDLFSNGRLILGVGIGWNYVEYDGLGYDFKTRGKRMDEQIPFLRRLWSEDVIEWRGQYDRIDRANLIPKPRRQIPIYCGGLSEPAYRRAAKLGDGFLFGGSPIPDIIGVMNGMKEMLKAEGRSPDAFKFHTYLMAPGYKGPDVQAAVDDLKRWQDAGGHEASIVSMGRGFKSADQHIDYYNEIRQRFG